MAIQKGERPEDKYDGETLYLLVKEGRDAPSIMAELGISVRATLISHLGRLMRERKEYLEIPGLYTRDGRATTNPTVGKGGKIVLSAKMLSGFALKKGQQFRITKSGNSILLRPAIEKGATDEGSPSDGQS